MESSLSGLTPPSEQLPEVEPEWDRMTKIIAVLKLDSS